MSPVALRWFAASMCVLAIAGRVAHAVWIQPLSWRVEPAALSLLIYLSGFAVSLGVPLALYAWASLRWRHPASLDVDAVKARFVVPTEPLWRGLYSIFTAWIAARAASFAVQRVPDGEGVRLERFPEVLISGTVALIWLAVTVLALLRNWPSLVLDPAGLTVRWLFWRRQIRWEDLVPGGPPPPAKRGFNSKLTLYLWPTGPYTAPPPLDVPVGQLGVSPEFLAATIRHYVEEPERRAGIGTDGELTRLRAALASPA